ncbi:hypothetical protein [Nitratiruptor sp. YY09-18]|uniref:hypothetical protein n=1 Tax=Nitratiruptor sp. YY09-18 TaxID=2724901 RepID=UPI001915680C|nr:hypothetical protein [Nitratiruptor sp. YY09-18]BCD67714.1 hypothetical protein NitYY0918_C0615 [Nitratiruptor sp. YY09-18]
MRELFRKKHQLWLQMLYGAFALQEGKEYAILLDFARIEFRHLKWLAKLMIKEGLDFDWDREHIDIVHKFDRGVYETLVEVIDKVEREYGVAPLFDRMKRDEAYMRYKLEQFAKQDPKELTAFDKRLFYEGLEGESLQALVEFLFEESYKEYELIVTYFYAAMHTSSKELYSIFEDLIYESCFHLKSFALLQAKLGILALPRVVMREVYKFEDLENFLRNGIDEEIAAKEQCKALSQAVSDEELQKFFDFINYQEDYHIELMREALAHLQNS